MQDDPNFRKKLFTEICCLEKDELQIEVLKDITTMIQHDNLFDMDCKINIDDNCEFRQAPIFALKVNTNFENEIYGN